MRPRRGLCTASRVIQVGELLAALIARTAAIGMLDRRDAAHRAIDQLLRSELPDHSHPALTLALSWITHRLAEGGQTIEQLIQSEIQLQAGEQVSIANSIGSLRFLGTMDWQEFVETMSVSSRPCGAIRRPCTGRWHSPPVTCTGMPSKPSRATRPVRKAKWRSMPYNWRRPRATAGVMPTSAIT